MYKHAKGRGFKKYAKGNPQSLLSHAALYYSGDATAQPKKKRRRRFKRRASTTEANKVLIRRRVNGQFVTEALASSARETGEQGQGQQQGAATPPKCEVAQEAGEQKVWYFAYGSNLDRNQMRLRCGSARFLCVAKLDNHRLAFTHRSIYRKCGTADALPSKGHEVWGVVYQIHEADVRALDKREGFDANRSPALNAYTRAECRVYRDGKEHLPMKVQTYFVAKPGELAPNAAYRDLIVNGARFWKLPAWYIKQIEGILVTKWSPKNVSGWRKWIFRLRW